MRKNPYIDVINANGHDFIEIGGVKWATCNIGAEKQWEPGLYFAWGETKGYTQEDIINGKKIFTWRDYNFGTSDNLTKYNDNDMKTSLDLEDDAAHVNWGGSWRMPTTDEYVALCKATNSAWTSNYQGNGKAGLVLTDKTDSNKVLFFPAAGYCSDGSMYGVGISGYYWSSSFYTSYVVYGYDMYFSVAYGYDQYFSSVYVNWRCSNSRYFGFPIRAVLDCYQ